MSTLGVAAASAVVFACAASAGIHAGLAPEHLREEPRVGLAFTTAIVVLLAIGVLAAIRPSAPWRARHAGLMLGGLIAAYVARRTTGIRLLAPDPDAVDTVGTAASQIELLGVVCALRTGQSNCRWPRRSFLQEVIR
jgi:hypothetical protein